jgi:TPR repeat protein
MSLGAIQMVQKHPEKARPYFERSLAGHEREYGAEDLRTGRSAIALAQTWDAEGQYARAEPFVRRGVEAYEQADNPDPGELAEALTMSCDVERRVLKLVEARAACRRAIEVVEKVKGATDVALIKPLLNLAATESLAQRHAESLVPMRRAHAIVLAAYGPDHALTRNVQAGIDEALKAAAKAGPSPKDPASEAAAAMQQLQRDADGGDARAQSRLAVAYELGRGVPKDEEKAAKYYRLAAEKGQVESQYFLGRLYAQGAGVSKDYAEALAWYRKSAASGYPPALNGLGTIYFNGHGVPADLIEGYKWFAIAVDRGNKIAENNRRSAEKRMTPEQVAEANARAAKAARTIPKFAESAAP